MFEKDCYNLGFVLKHHGFKGDLKVKTNLDISDDICKNWESVFFRINGILVPFFIERISILDARNLIIKFEGIDDDNSTYKSVKLFIDRDLYKSAPLSSYLEVCIGFKILNQNKRIGIISNIIEYPAQQMFKIKTEDGGECLVPVNPDWIVDVDMEQKQVLMNLPDGLIDLNE